MQQDYSLGEQWPHEPDYPLLRHVVHDLHPVGNALEFGVGVGSSLKVIAQHMFTVGFDSFNGLPEDWRDHSKGSFACDPPLDILNCKLVIGMFADTVPAFDFRSAGPVGLVHIDCDLYSSTKTVLDGIESWIIPGCFVVFDEFFENNGGVRSIGQEQKAWREFAQRTQVSWNVVGSSPESWAIQIV